LIQSTKKFVHNVCRTQAFLTAVTDKSHRAK